MPVKYPQFAEKRVTVMGLGLHGGGEGVVRFFANAGAKVIVTDLKTKKELSPSLRALRQYTNITYVLGRHRMEDFTHADIIVYNPGVRAKYMRLSDSPYLKAAIKAGVALETDISIFFDALIRSTVYSNKNTPIIGITGSKGKSTVATLIARMLKRVYPGTVLAGNIRTSVLDVLPLIVGSARKRVTPVVLELSSWQLEGLAKKNISPHVAVITNILREHLNTYKNFHAYVEAKKHILRFQSDQDIAILPKELLKASGFAKSCGRGKHILASWRDTPRSVTQALHLPGAHNRKNLALALAVADIFHISQKDIVLAVKSMRALEGRLETVARRSGITYINDTCATMPDAVIAALRCQERPDRVILIMGGMDKNFDYGPLARFIAVYPPKGVIVLPGSGTEKIRKELRMTNKELGIREAATMQDAVRAAKQMAKKGDTVLLSPGGASFNLFNNEFDRGEQFVRAVKFT